MVRWMARRRHGSEFRSYQRHFSYQSFALRARSDTAAQYGRASDALPWAAGSADVAGSPQERVQLAHVRLAGRAEAEAVPQLPQRERSLQQALAAGALAEAVLVGDIRGQDAAHVRLLAPALPLVGPPRLLGVRAQARG